MSFHGGLLGVVAAMALFAWRRGRNVADVFDFTAPLPALGLFFGRIGNFINGELWGKVTDRAVGLPASTAQVRHPSQLYEASLEGLVLFTVMWWFTARPRPRWRPRGCSCCSTAWRASWSSSCACRTCTSAISPGGWLTDGPAAVAAHDPRRRLPCWRTPTAPRALRQLRTAQ